MQVVYYTGIKGGIGKSFLSICTASYFVERKNIKPVVIDTDIDFTTFYDACTIVDSTNNGKKMPKECCKSAHLFSGDMETGWSKTLSRIIDVQNEEQNEGKNNVVIINAPANNLESLRQFAEAFNGFDNIDFLTMWVVDPLADSTDLLREYTQLVEQKICIVKTCKERNWKEKDFNLYYSDIENQGITSIFVKKSTEAIIKHTLICHKLLCEPMDVGDMILAKPWINKFYDKIEYALNNAKVFKNGN